MGAQNKENRGRHYYTWEFGLGGFKVGLARLRMVEIRSRLLYSSLGLVGTTRKESYSESCQACC